MQVQGSTRSYSRGTVYTMLEDDIENKFTEMINADPEIKLIDALEQLNIHVLNQYCWCNPLVEVIKGSSQQHA